MGGPLRKLHQNHSKVPAPPDMPDNCNIRTMTGSGAQSPPKRMEAHGFVSKNAWLEKASHEKFTHGPSPNAGNMIRPICPERRYGSHQFVTLSPFVAVYTVRSAPLSAVLLPFLEPRSE
jgi:hypothetical protein